MARRPKRPADFNKLAAQIVAESTGEAPPVQKKPDTRNPHAVALGKLGASKGGKARAAKLTPQRLSEIGRHAIAVRWAKQKKRPSPPAS